MTGHRPRDTEYRQRAPALVTSREQQMPGLPDDRVLDGDGFSTKGRLREVSETVRLEEPAATTTS